MKLHRYIDHDSQMTPIDFEVTRSKVEVTEYQEEAVDTILTVTETECSAVLVTHEMMKQTFQLTYDVHTIN
ncbi:hypothetical protein DPMN_106301 [Dreissena polymorpha]|uniref:Uncharacterized protein n=1 Tax=Dreissena polymorpha TaxID=45954 RepID=A0A9D4K4R4_DREPO|nr:hypothetical protein DPMN_106301 [Dreissena polymorpha]